jgi:hypothetical protein
VNLFFVSFFGAGLRPHSYTPAANIFYRAFRSVKAMQGFPACDLWRNGAMPPRL